MKVYWYECGRRHGNLGDKLTPLLLDYFGVPNEWSPPEKAALFGIGSILHRVPPHYQGIVWSTGALFRGEPQDFSAAHILAIRGKLTLSQIVCGERDAVCLGDGGLLASHFFRPARKRHKLGMIPHYAQADEPLFAELEKHPEIVRIDICDEPRSVIQQIGECENIISSSLHGLIIADSLGVPNRWIDVPGESSKILGSGFKFRDYYSIFDFENSEPEVIRPQDTLDRLLSLFENYERPGIEFLQCQLQDRLRTVVEQRSGYLWDKAKQNIIRREEAILQRLKQFDVRHMGVEGPTKLNGVPVKETEQFHSLDELREDLKRDTYLSLRFVLDCLSTIQKLHELGIVHGDIRDANITVDDHRLVFKNFGWRLPSEDTGTLAHANFVAADLCALGKLLGDLCEHNPHLATIACLLTHVQPKEPSIELTTASTLTQLLLANEVCTSDDNTSHPEAQQPLLAEVSRAVKVLLEAIAARDRKISSLLSDQETAHAYQWKTEVKLAAFELLRIVPEHATYILIDGDEWRGELAGGSNSVPFLERHGAYWGPPQNDDTAIRELTRLQRQGASYVVFGKPAFWWLDYYSGLRDYLDSSATCCHKDELLTVYQLRNDSLSMQRPD